jgi:GNAT superfamily N-acetyltransferase
MPTDATPPGRSDLWKAGFVQEPFRKRGIGKELMNVAEEWARTHGDLEMASDTWTDNEDSQCALEALGCVMRMMNRGIAGSRGVLPRSLRRDTISKSEIVAIVGWVSTVSLDLMP